MNKYTDFIWRQFKNKKKEIALPFICLIIVGLVVVLNFRTIFSTQDIAYFCFLFLAVFLPDLWFLFADKYFKDEIKEICEGGIDKLEKSVESYKLDKLAEYPKILGRIERVFYFVILTICNLKIINFLTIIGAWITIKAAGNYYWMPKKEFSKNSTYNKKLEDHCNRANFIIFLIGNLVSIGLVIITFFTMRWVSKCFNGCYWWCSCLNN
ncbi:MAG: hypothetical protein MUD10_04705 [Candidatus Pacebacteria bacterium]|jgi:hypothetical protein|nr:hypothetical protein [Candidatus Paceibacterota bacterium]